MAATKRVRWLLVAVVLAMVAGLPGPAGAKEKGRDHPITVMTRNLYFGADLEPVITAENSEDFQAALVGAFIQALGDVPAGGTDPGSNPWARMAAVAAEIEETGAVLVGLQEAAVWTVNGHPIVDFTDLIIAELAARGLRYEAVVAQTGFEFEDELLPGLSAGLAISDVILARTDLGSKFYKLSKPRSGHYGNVHVFETPVGDLPFLRQWVSIDVKVKGGKKFRFVSTHLEAVNPVVRAQQALELVTSPTSPLNTTKKPVVLVGDFNSEVGVEPFGITDAADIFLGSGFSDAWSGEGGFTFGHDADLADPTDGLDDSRIDYVMFRGKVASETVAVVDSDLDPGPLVRPLWPSDHGGVVATLALNPR
jgi:endonuclease/exonuclease/phosphatase family metal-dependent hydrolase